MIDQVENLLSLQLNIQSSMAIGGIYKEISNVSRSYEDAKKAINKSIFQSDKNRIIWYEDLPLVKNKYYYPAELEGRLINFVKAGDEAEANKLLQQLFQENFIDKHLSLPVLQLFLYDLIGTIMKMEHFDKQEERKMEYIDDMLYELETQKELGQTFNHIKNIYSKLCEEMTERKKSRNIDLKDNIIEYIHSEYYNPDLSLSTVADHFNMSEVYLSLFYKEQTGENFSEFLEKLRMYKAKKLLMEDIYSINEISNKVGYNTANTFGRAFKRIHGVSATAFKNSNYTP
jgi:YesN/AraC family two-component response regulator